MKPKQNILVAGQGPGWLCVEKPSGLSVHNQPGFDLVSRLKSCPDLEFSMIQPVHRLDKETSGLLLMATDPAVLSRLSDLFARKKIQKRYKTLVHGNFDLPDQAQGLWETPLSKQAGGRTNPGGKGKKVKAMTRYQVEAQTPHYALLDIELMTGRKHQIRRHAKLAGHPVIGDTRYGSARSIEFLKKKKQVYTMGLHAYFLEFYDHDQKITLEIEGITPDMARLLTEEGERG
ncbi:MAG: RNA pseudouridine synthase [Desulfobacter sp.]|nr:MAG: RNA pseudouridine synthase [Desulfobacter sp.]